MPVSFQGIRSASSIGVPQGGTGNSSIPAGEILVGDGTNPIYSIPVGSEGQVLTVVNGEWASADAAAGSGGSGGLSSITTSGNLQGNGTSGSPATLKSAISLTSVTASFKGDGSQITGLTAAQVSGIISSVSSSGNLQGDGTSGSALTLKDNISLTSVTASFSGNGSALTNLTASQIGGLNAAVDARITNIPNSALQNSAITVNGQSISLGGSLTIETPSANPTFSSLTASTGTFNGDVTIAGNLTVNGTQTVINTTDLTITDNIILIASGATNATQLNGAGIHFGRIPSEDARIVYDSSNDWLEIHPAVSASEFHGKFIGNGSQLTNIPNSALQHSSININGEEVALGGIFTINVPQAFGGVTTSGSLSGDGLLTPITLNNNISLTSVTASFKGDGSRITGLTAAQVSGIISSVSSSGNLQGDGTSGSPITLKSAISLTSVTASFNGSGAGLTNIPNSALTNNSITINGNPVSLGGTVTIPTSSANPSFTAVTASYFTGSHIGDGSALTNLSSSQISNFNSAVDARITNIPNSALQNSSITINGSSVSLGGSATIADQSSMTFTGSGFAVGNVVALSGSLVKADYSDDTSSNAFGVVSAVAGTTVTVKMFGEATALSASSYSTAGTLLYVGVSGSVTNYAGIPSGKYITQVGILSPNSGKLIIQPRIYGLKN